MNKRYQMNIRLDRVLVEEIDRLADDDHVDRSEMARRLLDHGIAARRMRRGLDEYRAGNVTAWRAAEIADVSLYEMLDHIHEEGIAYDLDPAVLDRVGAASTAASAVRERPASYGTDDTRGIAALRESYRPERTKILFVGESSPAGGTHFYRADSNLFRATQEAFVAAFGSDVVSDGPRFLREFQDRGCWLVDLADRPVNRLPDAERQVLVSQGVAKLAETISETEPEHVVAIKATIDDEVQAAMEVAGSDADLLALPFPVRQWRSVYVRRLGEALRDWSDSGHE